MSSSPAAGDFGQAIAFHDLFVALRRHIALVLLVALGGLSVGVLASIVLPPSIEATARIQVLPITVDASDVAGREDSLVEPALEIELLRSTDLLFEVARSVTPQANPDDLRNNLVVSNIKDTPLLVVSMTAGSQARALELVDEVVTTYLAQRQTRALDEVSNRRSNLQTRLSTLERELIDVNTRLGQLDATINGNAGTIAQLQGSRQFLQDQLIAIQTQVAAVEQLNTEPGRITDRARITDDGGLGPILTIIGGAALGIVLGIGIALIRDRTDDRLWDAYDVERALPDVPVVAVDIEELGVRLVDGPAYREIRDLVISFPVPSATTLVLASARDERDVPVVAAGVAQAISRAGLDTVLVDPVGSLELMAVIDAMGVDTDAPGMFDDFLFRDTPISKAATTSRDQGHLSVLRRAADSVQRDVTVSPRLRSLMWRESLSTTGDDAGVGTTNRSVVLAAPSIIDSPDGAVLGGMADTVILVTRARRTTRADITRTQRMLRTHGATIAAAIILPREDQ